MDWYPVMDSGRSISVRHVAKKLTSFKGLVLLVPLLHLRRSVRVALLRREHFFKFFEVMWSRYLFMFGDRGDDLVTLQAKPILSNQHLVYGLPRSFKIVSGGFRFLSWLSPLVLIDLHNLI